MRSYRNYTDQDIIEAAREATSIADLLKALGLKQAGGNYSTMKQKLQKLAIDTSHWTGQGWNKGEQLKDWTSYSKAVSLKKHLLRDRGHQCESCKLSIWLEQPITLELDHIDGDHTNNHLENLQLLCPNCHSFTPTWKNRKRVVVHEGVEPSSPG